MNGTAPKATDLAKLPLRAIAAYAARTARRAAKELRGVIADDIIDNVLDRTEEVWRTRNLVDVDQASLLYAVAGLYKATSDLGEAQARRVSHVVLCIARSARVAVKLAEAEREPLRADYYRQRAATIAEAAIRTVESLPIGITSVATLARQDYDFLVKEFESHDESIIGGPITCFGENS